MDKEIKKLWVDALRSGLYNQGKGKLKDVETGRFCCLGVLADVCEILQESGGIVDHAGWELAKYDLKHVPILRDEIPDNVQDYLASCNDDSDPDVEFKYLPKHIRDIAPKEHPRTFPEIADWIDKCL